MPRFIQGQDRQQVALIPECLDDFIADDNPVRIIDAFVDELNLALLGFEKAAPAATGRPSYHPALLLKIYIYGYLNRVQSSRQLERECQRNVELMWLVGRLAPDFKTIADFRRDSGTGIRNVCRRFVAGCRDLKLFSQALVAVDGSKFKAVNTRDKSFTMAKIDKRQQQIEESIHRYLAALDSADRTQPVEIEARTVRLNDKIERLRKQMGALDDVKERLKDSPDSAVGDRLECPPDGYQRPGLGDGRLQRADGCRSPAPLTQAMSEERITATAPPTSSGRPTRPSAMPCATCAFTFLLSRFAPPPKSVAMAPGTMKFTRIWRNQVQQPYSG